MNPVAFWLFVAFAACGVAIVLVGLTTRYTRRTGALYATLCSVGFVCCLAGFAILIVEGT